MFKANCQIGVNSLHHWKLDFEGSLQAFSGAFHSCGVNRVHYLCSRGHESCVF